MHCAASYPGLFILLRAAAAAAFVARPAATAAAEHCAAAPASACLATTTSDAAVAASAACPAATNPSAAAVLFAASAACPTTNPSAAAELFAAATDSVHLATTAAAATYPRPAAFATPSAIGQDAITSAAAPPRPDPVGRFAITTAAARLHPYHLHSGRAAIHYVQWSTVPTLCRPIPSGAPPARVPQATSAALLAPFAAAPIAALAATAHFVAAATSPRLPHPLSRDHLQPCWPQAAPYAIDHRGHSRRHHAPCSIALAQVSAAFSAAISLLVATYSRLRLRGAGEAGAPTPPPPPTPHRHGR